MISLIIMAKQQMQNIMLNIIPKKQNVQQKTVIMPELKTILKRQLHMLKKPKKKLNAKLKRKKRLVKKRKKDKKQKQKRNILTLQIL